MIDENGRAAATATAAAFAEHRRSARALPEFPGTLPADLASAYAIQQEATRLWGKPVAGWKIGRINGDAEVQSGENRFVGPIFADTVWPLEAGDTAAFPAVPDGFAAFEAELIAVIGEIDGRDDWTAQTCGSAITAWHIGIEVAGSPYPGATTDGSFVTTAAFGTNMGLLIGPEITGTDPDDVACTTVIAGEQLPSQHASNLPGGPLTAVAFALNRLHRMGIAVPPGTLLSTGAITGVHPVSIGQDCSVTFEPGGTLACAVVPLAPEA